MKKIKFPLEMKNGYQVREMDELQEYFDLERAVEYFSSGRLQKWLENTYNDDILEELEELTGDEDDFIARFTEALGVECKADSVDIQKLLRQSMRKERLKRLLPEEEAEKILTMTADTQENLEELTENKCNKIYLLSGSFIIKRTMKDIEFIGLDTPEIKVEETDANRFRKQKIRLTGSFTLDLRTEKIIHRDVLGDTMMDLLDVLEMQIKQIG